MSSLTRLIASRRSILKLGLANTLASMLGLGQQAGAVENSGDTFESVSSSSAANSTPSQARFISGARRAEDDYVAVVLDEQANIVSMVSLPARAHGAASHAASHRACVFARRPGLYISAFDIRNPDDHRCIQPVHGRNFYGHGAFSGSGNTLFVTENDFDHARGVLGVYDASGGYRRVAEMGTDGIGPHDVVRVPGSELLVVANGGIKTHPDSGRDKLNIETMSPSLTIIDTRLGKVVGRAQVPHDLHQVSLRHLVCDAQGIVWFAGQYEGSDPTAPALAGSLSIRESMDSYRSGPSSAGMNWLLLPMSLNARLAGYLSSVALVGDHVVFTSARGGVAFWVHRTTRRVEASMSVFDGSGVAAGRAVDATYPDPAIASGNDASKSHASYCAEQTFITSGTGELTRWHDGSVNLAKPFSVQWDNHLHRVDL